MAGSPVVPTTRMGAAPLAWMGAGLRVPLCPQTLHTRSMPTEVFPKIGATRLASSYWAAQVAVSPSTG